MKILYLLIIVLSLTIHPALAEQSDSTDTIDDILSKIKLDVGFGIYHMQTFSGNMWEKKVRTPEYIQDFRYSGFVTDNPMVHGASYIDFQAISEISRDLNVYASLTAEHQGYSYGTYNKNKIEVYPKYQVVYRTQPEKKKGFPLVLGLNIGNFQGTRYYEGLQLYNIDFQGVFAYTQFKKLRLSYFHIGDLSYAVGLNLEEYVDYMISLERIKLGTQYAIDLRLGFADYSMRRNHKTIDVINFSVGAQRSDILRLYGQIGYRYIDGDFDYRLKYASLVGVNYVNRFNKFSLDLRSEYRYYGGMFNYRLKGYGQVYRNERYIHNGSYFGSALYPLSFLDRPFSQWAVFTEYHKRYVAGVSLFAKMRYYIVPRYFLYAELDFNGIKADDEEFFLYPFYKLGLGFKPAKGVHAVFGISNKIINLDKYYPTYYNLEDPQIMFELRRDVDWPEL